MKLNNLKTLGWKGWKARAITAIVLLIIVVGVTAYRGTGHGPSSLAIKNVVSTAAASSTSHGIPPTAKAGAYASSDANSAAVVQRPPTVGPVIIASSLTQNTADWKICENIQYGYEVKYPLQWMQFADDGVHWSQESPVDCEGKQTVTFSANDPLVEKITIAVYPGNATSGIPALNATAAEPGMSWQETTIDNDGALWNALIDVGNNTRTDSVDIRHDGRLYVITYWFSTATTYINLSEVYFQTMAENMIFQ